MAGKKQKQEGVGAWIAIVILFAVGLWPIALVMLLVKLFGNDGQKRRQAPPPLQTAAPEPAAAPRGGASCWRGRDLLLNSPTVTTWRRPIRRDCRQDQKGRAQRHEVPGGEEV